jgi:hypothetical protein
MLIDSCILLIFVRHGQLLLRKKEEALVSLERGSYLELSLIHPNVVRTSKGQFKRKNISVVSTALSDFSILDVNTFKALLKKFPTIAEQYDRFYRNEEDNFQAALEAERKAQLELERVKMEEKKKAVQLEFLQAAR